jgi:hypothetical protein
MPDGRKIYAVHGFNPFEPPDHEAFDDPAAADRWRRIHWVAMTMMGMSPVWAYWHACETVFGELAAV